MKICLRQNWNICKGVVVVVKKEENRWQIWYNANPLTFSNRGRHNIRCGDPQITSIPPTACTARAIGARVHWLIISLVYSIFARSWVMPIPCHFIFPLRFLACCKIWYFVSNLDRLMMRRQFPAAFPSRYMSMLSMSKKRRKNFKNFKKWQCTKTSSNLESHLKEPKKMKK